MTFGITSTGFVLKTLADIKDEVETALRDDINNGLDFSSDTPLGQLTGVFNGAVAELWLLGQSLYRAFDSDSNGGDAQDITAALVGVTRLDQEKSTVTVTLGGTPATVVPAGSLIQVTGTTDQFVTDSNATIGGGGTIDVTATAVEYGAVIALAGTLTEIVTPVVGWSTVTNAADAIEGRLIETDEELRLRRAQLLRAQGNAALDAIVADVLDVSGVTSCFGIENTDIEEDADGLPGKSFEIVVSDGAVNDIAQAIWDSKAAGMQAYGITSGTAVDIKGDNRTMYFTRPTEKPVYIEIDINYIVDEYPSDGDTQIKELIEAYGNTLLISDGVVEYQVNRAPGSVSGVYDVTAVRLGFSASPTGTANLAIGIRERAIISAANITINKTAV